VVEEQELQIVVILLDQVFNVDKPILVEVAEVLGLELVVVVVAEL
tara:strand:- start:30 stop:164 length:135 start_codon:yes stop_codon:yes gene_type:complete